jgi:hypothetical protein
MARNHKAALLEGLDSIEDELSSHTGKAHLSPKEEAEEVAEKGHTKVETPESEAKEIEHHLVASGQFDCPHCGGKVKVGEKHAE